MAVALTTGPAPHCDMDASSFDASLLGRAVRVMRDLLADPAAMPDRALRRHSLPLSLHSFDLNMLWLWSEPVAAFLDTVAGLDRLGKAAVTGSGAAYMVALKGLVRRPLSSALAALRVAFRQPPEAATIERVGRIVLHDLRPSHRGIAADLAAFRDEPLPCRLDLWLEELNWPVLVETAEGRDRAVRTLVAGLSGLTMGAIQREMRRIAA